MPLRRLQGHGMMGEACVVEREPETFPADLPIADVGMTVDTRPQALFGVVQAEETQPLEADFAVEGGKGVRIALGRAQVIASGERLAAVETRPEAVGEAGMVDDDDGDFTEVGAALAALAGGQAPAKGSAAAGRRDEAAARCCQLLVDLPRGKD